MSASETVIRPVGPADLPAFRLALQRLAADLGDPFEADEATLRAALFDRGAAFGLLTARDGAPQGAVLASPVVSTAWGGAGLFVSDLWVAPRARGSGLGARLLAAAAQAGAQRWGARFLKLTVYADNTRAQAFYARLGFTLRPRDRNAVLQEAAFAQLADLAA